MEIKEISISGPRSKYMYDFMIKHGANFLRIDKENNYIFIDDDSFKEAFSELEIEIRKGFFNKRR